MRVDRCRFTGRTMLRRTERQNPDVGTGLQIVSRGGFGADERDIRARKHIVLCRGYVERRYAAAAHGGACRSEAATSSGDRGRAKRYP